MVSGANLYFYCYYGNRASNDYSQMAHILFESNWNEQSVEVQKFIKMMIANAQRPLFYHGLRIVHLDLQTYLKMRTFSIYVQIFEGKLQRKKFQTNELINQNISFFSC